MYDFFYIDEITHYQGFINYVNNKCMITITSKDVTLTQLEKMITLVCGLAVKRFTRKSFGI